MNFLNMIEEKWQAFCENTKPAREKCGRFLRKTGKVLKIIWAYVYKLRAALLAVPVAIGAIWLAVCRSCRTVWGSICWQTVSFL